MARKRRVETVHQIGVGFAAPVPTDLIHEPLTVPERSAWIDCNDTKPGRCEQLEIPPSMPLIEPFALRPAMNEE